MNPVLAIIAIAAVVLIAGIFIWRSGAGAPHANGEKPPGMPADVSKEFAQRMGGVTGPGSSTAPAPGVTSGGGAAASGGYIMPPVR